MVVNAMRAEDYSQPDLFQIERRLVFTSGWLPACAEGQLAQPGDFRSDTVGGWGIVAVRDAAGQVRVLRNLCRHQAMAVVDRPSGNCERFRCPFHGWVYDLSGKLIGKPPSQGTHDPTAPSMNMVPFVVALTGGMVFFSLDGMAAPPALDRPPAYGGTIEVDMECNWKVVVEHLLATAHDGEVARLWPLLTVHRTGSRTMVQQIVPRATGRTGLLVHVFGDRAEEHREPIEAFKPECEALQAERAAGRMAAADNDLVAAFHRRLDEIHAVSAKAT